ncbi:hypothetical protein HY837_04030 [archaeon]|nr:hypothetical protein [archaeon]
MTLKIKNLIDQKNLLNQNSSIAFCDGAKIYQAFAKKYKTHKKGFFILAPSGAGKTHFIVHQKEKNWMDGDDLWKATKAMPKDGWWLSLPIINEVEQRCDIVTHEAKKRGFWILGASNYWMKPDAIVIPHWKTHKKYIKYREEHNYDGGATSDRLQQVISHRKQILGWIKKGVPRFKSVKEATDYLNKLEHKK